MTLFEQRFVVTETAGPWVQQIIMMVLLWTTGKDYCVGKSLPFLEAHQRYC